MAKRKTKKKTYPKDVTDKTTKKATDGSTLEKRAALEDKVIDALEQRIAALEQRIDRIVAALGKSKSVRGM